MIDKSQDFARDSNPNPRPSDERLVGTKGPVTLIMYM